MKNFDLYDVEDHLKDMKRQGYPFRKNVTLSPKYFNQIIERVLELEIEYNEAANAYNKLAEQRSFSKSEIKKLKFATHPDRNNGDDTAYRLIQKIIGE